MNKSFVWYIFYASLTLYGALFVRFSKYINHFCIFCFQKVINKLNKSNKNELVFYAVLS